MQGAENSKKKHYITLLVASLIMVQLLSSVFNSLPDKVQHHRMIHFHFQQIASESPSKIVSRY